MQQKSFNKEELLRRELVTDENLLWSGVPDRGIKFVSSDIFLIPFSIVWASFAFSTLFRDFENTLFFPFSLFSLLFVFAGVYITVGRFLVDSFFRSRTIYGITDRRIIILSDIIITRKVETYWLSDLSKISLSESGNGKGSIFLGDKGAYFNFFGNTNLFGRKGESVPCLAFIENAREVHNKILKLKEESKNRISSS
ncbi:hypothetical protein [Leptospira koniambonensis]|uniref:hypothetical protein n=1 Tax=Leptospira koniambonensis TaxID=2484950 RepID=UPI003EB9CF77